MREELDRRRRPRAAHFASNLGVVELCLALHLTFDFSRDRLIWDTGHQIYPHKLITGRCRQLHTIRTKGGLMGYPNPAESPYDLFMTGHAGCAPSTALGLKAGDDLIGPARAPQRGRDRRRRLPLRHRLRGPQQRRRPARRSCSSILNDNKMSICPRVGGLAQYLDRARMTHALQRLEAKCAEAACQGPARRRPGRPLAPADSRTRSRPSLHRRHALRGTGLPYFGPIDGHDLRTVAELSRPGKDDGRPGPAARAHRQGPRVRAGREDPVTFHAPPPFQRRRATAIVPLKNSVGARPTPMPPAPRIFAAMQREPEGHRDDRRHVPGEQAGEGPRRRSPTASSTSASANRTPSPSPPAWPRPALRPIVDIYSTFLQRSFDQIFQEVVAAEPAGRLHARPRRPRRARRADASRLVRHRPTCGSSPTWSVMAPGDEKDVAPMLDFALEHDGPMSIRYPKANLETIERDPQPIELGQAEVLEWETDGDDPRLRHAGRPLRAGRGAAPRARGLRRRRHQRPLRQAARPGHHAQGGRGDAVRAHGRGGHPRRRVRLGRARGGQRRRRLDAPRPPAWLPRPLRRTPSATNSSPSWASTSMASPAPWNWPGPSACTSRPSSRPRPRPSPPTGRPWGDSASQPWVARTTSCPGHPGSSPGRPWTLQFAPRPHRPPLQPQRQARPIASTTPSPAETSVAGSGHVSKV